MCVCVCVCVCVIRKVRFDLVEFYGMTTLAGSFYTEDVLSILSEGWLLHVQLFCLLFSILPVFHLYIIAVDTFYSLLIAGWVVFNGIPTLVVYLILLYMHIYHYVIVRCFFFIYIYVISREDECRII